MVVVEDEVVHEAEEDPVEEVVDDKDQIQIMDSLWSYICHQCFCNLLPG